jgi:hypothetical protein
MSARPQGLIFIMEAEHGDALIVAVIVMPISG